MLTTLRERSGRVRGLSLALGRGTSWTTGLAVTRDGAALRVFGRRTLRIDWRRD